MTHLSAAVDAALAGNDEPITFEQICESVQAQIGKLTRHDRRRIKEILYWRRQRGLVVKTGQGRYVAEPPGLCGTPDLLKRGFLEGSVIDFISARRGEAFALRDAYGSMRLYSDAVRRRYMVRRFIDRLCRAGQLEPAGPQRYRATASFQDGSDEAGAGPAGRPEGTAP